MKVQAVDNNKNYNKLKTYYDFSKAAGYGALGTGGLCLIQGMRHKKSHKALGLLSVILASIHVGIIEFLHRNNQNNTIK